MIERGQRKRVGGDTSTSDRQSKLRQRQLLQYAMDWKPYIHSNPKILMGKPVIKGTRLSVEFILGLLAEGWSEQQLLESYPTLEAIALQAVFAFAVDCLKEDVFYAPLFSTSTQ